MASGVAINVGVNTKPEWGGFRGPIFSDGFFEFIHVPWKEHYGMIEPEPKKYSEMSYAPYVPSNLLDKYVFISPDFCNSTYASTTDAPANTSIWKLEPNDLLFFYAILDRINVRHERLGWGAYIIGFFKINSIYESIYQVLASESGIEEFEEYQWFKILTKDPDDWAPWVKGQKGKSGLLLKAVPLTEPEDPEKWNKTSYDLFRTQTGKSLGETASPRVILTCCGDNLEKLLTMCTLRIENSS